MARLDRVTPRVTWIAGRESSSKLWTHALLLAIGVALVASMALLARDGRLLRSEGVLVPLIRGGAAPGTPAELAAGAAQRLDEALASSGGLTFEIVQTSTLVARQGGPRIPIPDPSDRHKTLGLADTYPLTTLAEFGVATRDGFYAEIRQAGADGQPDPRAELLFQALVRGPDTFRNDGRGWYATDAPPGIGLDPLTVRMLPQLLRNATEPRDTEPEPVGGLPLRALTATGRVADIPGVIAADGAGFTVLTGPITVAFTEDGRLAKLRVDARNTNLDTFDLIVRTEIEFQYGGAGELPLPEPPLASDLAEVVP